MKPRDLAGLIRRAKCIYVWVPYAEMIPYGDDDEGEELSTEAAAVGPELTDEELDADASGPIAVASGEVGEPYDGPLEEVGIWLAVKRVQAREIVLHAYDDPDIADIAAFEEDGELFIGLGPEEDGDDEEDEGGVEEEVGEAELPALPA